MKVERIIIWTGLIGSVVFLIWQANERKRIQNQVQLTWGPWPAP